MAFAPLSSTAKEFRFGHYRHFKGKDYTALMIARDSETGEEMVVYREEYEDRMICVRPLTMFLETVDRDGKVQPRFAYVGPAETIEQKQ